MSNPSSSVLRALLYRRLCEVFGPPESAFGRDDHWSLPPSRSQASVNLLIDGTGEHPAIWIFDPHSTNNGVLRQIITTDAEVESIICHVQQRLQGAAANAAAKKDDLQSSER